MRDVFVSKPSALTEQQRLFWKGLEGRLSERGLRPRTLGVTDYPNVAPFGVVKEVLSECYGAVILGLKQIRVVQGIAKEGTKKEEVLVEHYLPTAWNHVEAGMAFALRLPLMLIREEGVSGGVFDAESSDRFVHQVTLPVEKWLSSEEFLQPLNRWVEEIIKLDTNHR